MLTIRMLEAASLSWAVVERRLERGEDGVGCVRSVNSMEFRIVGCGDM